MKFSDDYQYEPIASTGLKIWSKTNPKLVFVWSGSDWDEVNKIMTLLKWFDMERVEEEEVLLDEETKTTIKDVMEGEQQASL